MNKRFLALFSYSEKYILILNISWSLGETVVNDTEKWVHKVFQLWVYFLNQMSTINDFALPNNFKS